MDQEEFLRNSLNKCLNEIETAELAGYYEKCVELYLKAANIAQRLGDKEKILEFSQKAKEYRQKLQDA